MRAGLFFVLAFAATSFAMPSGVELAGEMTHKLAPKVVKRGASAVDGLKSREISGGFIAVLPKESGEPAEGAGESTKKRRRLLRKDEIAVPDTLQDHNSKRYIYCKNSGYGLCPNLEYCCPLGGLCCSNGGCCKKGQRCCSFDGCCPSTSNCVIVDGQEGCCPIGKTCTATGNECATSGYVPCSNYDFCCKPGYTCYRDSAGTALCRAPGSNNNPTTTTRTTTTTTTTTQPDIYTQTTIRVTDGFSTSDLVQATDSPTSFPGLPTTTTTPSPFNTTSSASRTSSSVEVPIGASGSGALAVTPTAAYGVLLSALFVAVGQGFVA